MDVRSADPAFGSAGYNVRPDVDLAFDSGTLRELRAHVEAGARLAGMRAIRAGDVVLAVHELAANAVRHGAGEGRLRIWNRSGALRCQIEDGELCAPREVMGAAGGINQVLARPWQGMPGHGLWVVRQVSDQMQLLVGPRGTRATIAFDLP